MALLSSMMLIFPLIAMMEFPLLDKGSSYAHCIQVCNYSHIHHVGPFHKKITVFQAQYEQLSFSKHHTILIAQNCY